MAYVFIAHDLAVVKHVSDRVAVMYLGKVVEFADSDELHHKPLHPYTQALLASIPEPDPSRSVEDKPVLEGEVPSPRNPPPGCRFHTRCPFAQPKCRTDVPELKPGPGVSPEHLVACHYAGELTAKSA
ncbi:MAG: peptide/nickel transport system ATP-binding protein [Elusimicrobia bacterium]|nr:MAG: peptide/nickel transport system ATP-binding protein [Elusimicrobiota bacterium]